MSINFSPYPYAAYQGPLVSKPYARFGQSGSIVSCSINWSQYGVGLEPLGNLQPNFVVIVNFQASATVPQPFLVASCYVDNLGSDVPLYVYFPDTGYTITVAADSEGWFPVISNSPVAWIIALNLETGFLPLTKVFFTDLYVPPYVNVSTPQSLGLELASPLISLGGGSSIASIVPDVSGQSYQSGAITISGGGGSGATAVGTLDMWGRFTAVAVVAGGTGFTGVPIVTATALNPAAAQFNGTVTYDPGVKVSYNNIEWECDTSVPIQCGAATWNQTTADGPGYPTGSQVNDGAGNIWQATTNRPLSAPGFGGWGLVGSAVPTTSGNWLSSGSPGGIGATFTITLTGSTSPIEIVSQGTGPRALGDQSACYVDSFTTDNFVFRHNLFGTPFASGFIYLTHIDISVPFCDSGSELTWQMENSEGFVLYEWLYESFSDTSNPGTIMRLQGMNVKLDATVEWRLRCTLGPAQTNIQSAFTWTYNQG